MEHRQTGVGDGDDRREVIQYSSVPRFNNASDVHVTNTNSGFNGGTGTHPNMMMPQQTPRQRLPNGYNRYGRSHPNMMMPQQTPRQRLPNGYN